MKNYLLCLIFGLMLNNAVAQTAVQSLIVQRADVPLYPPVAKAARISGTVRVEITVKNGAVTNTDVKFSAHPMLVKATLDNIKTFQFVPDANGTFVTTYTYVLEKKETRFPENPRIEMQLPQFVRIVARPTKLTCNDCVSDGNTTANRAISILP